MWCSGSKAMLMTAALTCLAMNIYAEARGESFIGQHAVAQVTMNRAKRDSKNVCGVVTASGQFSWTTKVVRKINGKYVLLKKAEPKDKKAWALARGIAFVTMKGWTPDIIGGATFYHTKTVSPYWSRSKSLKLVTVIGQHCFYRFA
jgi:N-acetylmuramoyl-L-alanine amidase